MSVTQQWSIVISGLIWFLVLSGSCGDTHIQRKSPPGGSVPKSNNETWKQQQQALDNDLSHSKLLQVVQNDLYNSVQIKSGSLGRLVRREAEGHSQNNSSVITPPIAGVTPVLNQSSTPQPIPPSTTSTSTSTSRTTTTTTTPAPIPQPPTPPVLTETTSTLSSAQTSSQQSSADKPSTIIEQTTDKYIPTSAEQEPTTVTTEETDVVPVFHDIHPGYGPKAGGTIITLFGDSITLQVEAVTIGKNDKYSCHIIDWNATRIVAETPEAIQFDILRKHPVAVHFVGGLKLPVEDQEMLYFEYRPNPILQSVYPLNTIIQGGTSITLRGHHLDSTAETLMVITMVYRWLISFKNDEPFFNETHSQYIGSCEEFEETSLKCTSPALNISDEIIQIPAYTTDSTSSPSTISSDAWTSAMLDSTQPIAITDSTDPNQPITTTDTNTISNSPVPARLNRVKRKPDKTGISYKTQDVELHFYLGFKFDGLETYQTVSELAVYEAPTIQIRHPDQPPLEFQKDALIYIQGKNLRQGVDPTDYRVTIGQEECTIDNINSTTLSCLPPQHAPDKVEMSSKQYHLIKVYVGHNIMYTYCSIHYETTSLLVIIGPVVGAVVLVAIIVILACLFILRHRARHMKSTKKYHYSQVSRTLPPPIYMDDIQDRYVTKPESPDQVPPSFRPDVILDLNGIDDHNNDISHRLDRDIRFDEPDFEHAKRNVIRKHKNPKTRLNETNKQRKTGDNDQMWKDVPKSKRGQSLPTNKGPHFLNPFYNDLSKSGFSSGPKSQSDANSDIKMRQSAQGSDRLSDFDDIYVNEPGSPQSISARPEPGYANYRKKVKSKHSTPDPKPKGLGQPGKGKQRSKLPYNKSKESLNTVHSPEGTGHGPTLPSRLPKQDMFAIDPTTRWVHQTAHEDKFYKHYGSDSDDNEQIYMNSPIKSQGRQSGRKSRAQHIGRGATLWY